MEILKFKMKVEKIMADITGIEKSVKKLFVGKCWQYLYENFHKFSEVNRIKIALKLCEKDMPQQLEGNLGHTVRMGEIRVGDEKVEYDIGSENANDTTEDTKHTPEAISDSPEPE